ncbi:hypothetical protein CRM22_010778 [Opisthorchis felineus]|uniref:Uncharacterized protein n=1 Tax=Opisthorchis felineus TaxID=147828 RepID=A0A4S2KMT4_OPIFE|nr:hypothetical protein CRM22_010778 [Opisthorchis felineus]TGZ50626.1 hypothetical protein CRM22_010778 [Opisthorchis felineus]
MTSFKITIPSERTPSGQEVTRWLVKKPKEEITYELLVGRLRDIIPTPTSGYNVIWTDEKNTHLVTNTEQLYEAIRYFEEKKFPDRCVRLQAEPRDVIDVASALELMSLQTEPQSCRPSPSTSKTIPSNETTVPPKNLNLYLVEDSSVLTALKRDRLNRLVVQANESVTIAPQPPFDADWDVISNVQHKAIPSEATVLNPVNELPSIHSKPQSKTGTHNSKSAISTTRHPVNRGTYMKSLAYPLTEGKEISEGGRNSQYKMSRSEIDTLARKFYKMGFHFEEKTLISVIEDYKGDANLILDKLTQMQNTK